MTPLADHLAPVILIFHRGEQLISSHVALALVLEGSFAPPCMCTIMLLRLSCVLGGGVVKSFLDTPKARGMKCLLIHHESRNNGSTANQRLLPASFLWAHCAAIVTEHEEKQQSAFPFSPPPTSLSQAGKSINSFAHSSHQLKSHLPPDAQRCFTWSHHSTTLISPLLSVIYC